MKKRLKFPKKNFNGNKNYDYIHIIEHKKIRKTTKNNNSSSKPKNM